jgi:hypothetical protein
MNGGLPGYCIVDTVFLFLIFYGGAWIYTEYPEEPGAPDATVVGGLSF